MSPLFDELQRYVGFSQADQQALRALHGRLAPHFPAVAMAFYDVILRHPGARAALERGERQVGQLKDTLVRWMNDAFQGPWDDAWVERRARIGRVHVQIGLPQHYMITAMNVLRRALRTSIGDAEAPGSPAWRAGVEAMERALDLDLALMLHTYREDSEARQARAERLATYGQLVGSIGHELRNPLGVIETSLYVLTSKGTADPSRTRKHLDRIGQQVTVANDIITQLLDLIRDRPLKLEAVPLGALAADVVAVLERPPALAVELAGFEGLPAVRGDATQLRQVLVNLLENAVDAASEPREGAAARVRLEARATADGVVLTVDDTGAGIEPAVMARLFEPLVTSKPKGIGLGLPLVRRIVERHQGTITAGRSPLGGARFTVTLKGGPR